MDLVTVPELLLMVKAEKQKQKELKLDRYLRAYLGVAAGSTKKAGKKVVSRYPRFTDFYKEDEKPVSDAVSRQLEFRRMQAAKRKGEEKNG